MTNYLQVRFDPPVGSCCKLIYNLDQCVVRCLRMAKIESDSIEQEAEEVNQWLAFNNLPTETTYSRYLAVSMIDPSLNVKKLFCQSL